MLRVTGPSIAHLPCIPNHIVMKHPMNERGKVRVYAGLHIQHLLLVATIRVLYDILEWLERG